jgi:flagellar M-ring protein FliF
VVNYEISRSTKTEVTEGGRVNRVSVAVLVDGSYSKNDKGEQVYQPREKEEIDRIAALVRTAIGFDQKRGDQVEIVNLRFADVPANVIAEPTGFMSYLQFTKDDVMHWVELLVMLVLGLLVMLFVVRPLVRRVISSEQPTAAQPVIAAALAGGDVPAALAAGATVEEIKAVSNQTAKMIDIAQVQGQVHAQSVQKVGELADKNPNETVSIIRTWLHESAA